MSDRPAKADKSNGESTPLRQRLESLLVSCEQLRLKHDEKLESLHNATRNYHALLSMIGMPQLHLDQDWRIVSYSGNFPVIAKNISRLAANRVHLRELLEEGDFARIEAWQERVRALSAPHPRRNARWELEYEGPSTDERIGRDWLVSMHCSLGRWRIEEREGRVEIVHDEHRTDLVDCFLMLARKLNRPDRDLKVVYRVRTSGDKDNIRDLSLVIGGTLGKGETLCDALGYTICTGSLDNTMSRIQRETADLVSVKETLDVDTEYEITVERIGGRFIRRLKNLCTGKGMITLQAVDTNAVYDRSPYIGFSTFCAGARIFDIRVFTQKASRGIEEFRIPFDIEVGLGSLPGRRFRLRTGEECFGDRLRRLLLFEDVTSTREAEKRLLQSESKYRALFEMESDALFLIVDEGGQILEANPAAEKMYGYSRAELLGMRNVDLSAEPDETRAAGMSRSTQVPLRWHRKKDGTAFPVEISAGRFIWQGKPVHLAAIRQIGERVRAELELTRQKEFLQQVIDLNPNLIYVIGPDGRVMLVNRAFLEMHGTGAGRIIGGRWVDFLPDKAAARGIDRINRDLLAGQLKRYEREELFTDVQGRKRWTYTIKIPVRSSGGEISQVIGVSTDITEIKRSEQALRNSEERYRNLFEHSNDAVFIHDLEGRFLDVNRRACQLLGYSRQQLLKLRTFDLHPADVRDRAGQEFQQLSRKRSVVFETALQRRDGVRIEVELSGRIIDPTDGTVQGVVRDITERKHAERLMAQAHAEIDQMFNTTNPIDVIDLDFNVVRVNRTWVEKFGLREEDVVGRKCHEVFRTPRCGTDDCPLAVIRSDREIFEIEISRSTADGGQAPFILTASPLYRPDGELYAIIESYKDISELKQLEQERLRLDKLESVGLLAGGIAHDFNNILTAILGNASLAKMFVTPGDKVYEPLHAIESSSLRARELTTQLLSFSRGAQPVKRAASLEELVREAVNFSLSGSNVSYELKIEPKLWPVEVDPGQINQVLNNLIINADQAMPDGGRIVIELLNCAVDSRESPVLEKGRYVKLSVRDSGVGINEEHLGRIFDPYFTTKQKGSGLGLATSYTIVKRHGGDIRVESKPGKGSVFSIWLPVSSRNPVRMKDSSTVHHGGGSRVMVMDDEEDVRRVLGYMLDHLGYKAEFASNGAEAVQLYVNRKKQGHPFDAVIMDLTVPGGMGGIEAVRRLRQIDPDLRAIVSSGYSSESSFSDYREHGFDDSVAKPYRIGELEAALSRVLTRRVQSSVDDSPKQ